MVYGISSLKLLSHCFLDYNIASTSLTHFSVKWLKLDLHWSGNLEVAPADKKKQKNLATTILYMHMYIYRYLHCTWMSGMCWWLEGGLASLSRLVSFSPWPAPWRLSSTEGLPQLQALAKMTWNKKKKKIYHSCHSDIMYGKKHRFWTLITDPEGHEPY